MALDHRYSSQTGTPSSTTAGTGATASDFIPQVSAQQQSPQFLSSFAVWPYLFPAYGLFHLAASLEVGAKVPDWYQLIRAAVMVTAQVEDLVSLSCAW